MITDRLEETYLSLEHYKALISLEGADISTLDRMMTSMRSYVSSLLFKPKTLEVYNFKLDIKSSKKKLDTVPYLHLVDMRISKPENFEGYFSDYATMLKLISKEIFNDTLAVIGEADVTVSAAINSNDLSSSPFKTNAVLKELSRKRELCLHNFKTYFPTTNNTSKTTLGDVTKNTLDIFLVVNLALDIKEITNTFGTETIVARTKDLNDKTLALHDKIRNKELTNVSKPALLQLSDSIYSVGKQVELYSLVVTHAITYLKVIEHLVEDLGKH